MDKNKYIDLINQSIKNPENAPNYMNDLISEIEKDSKEFENLNTINEENQKKIRELQDTNMKLFLSQTITKEVEQEEKELTPDEIIEDFIKELKGENN